MAAARSAESIGVTMSDLKQSFFTRVLNPIKNNKYFNHKDALVYGATAAGAGGAYAATDGDIPLSVAGGAVGFAAGVGALGYRGGLKSTAIEMGIGAAFGAVAAAGDPNGNMATWATAGAAVGLGLSGLSKRAGVDFLRPTPQQVGDMITGNNKRGAYTYGTLAIGPSAGAIAGAGYSLSTDKDDFITSTTIGGKLGSLPALGVARYVR